MQSSASALSREHVNKAPENMKGHDPMAACASSSHAVMAFFRCHVDELMQCQAHELRGFGLTVAPLPTQLSEQAGGLLQRGEIWGRFFCRHQPFCCKRFGDNNLRQINRY